MGAPPDGAGAPGPDGDGVARAVAFGQAVALGLGVIGGLGLAFTTADGPNVNLVTLMTGTRTGNLLLARTLGALAGSILAVALLLAGRPRAASVVAGAAGAAGIVLLALGGHTSAGTAAAFAAMVVHLVAAATWLAGLVALAASAALRRGSASGAAFLREAVPRFSALALVSIALVAATGLVAEWALVRSLAPLGTAYGVALGVKVLIVVVALGLGARNYLDGGRGRPTEDRLRRRLGGEAILAVAVLIAAGNLASGSPPSSELPVAIERAPSSVAATLPLDLQVLPGRPGPNRLDVVVPGGLDPRSTVDLVLQRLDTGAGEARYELRRVAGAVLARLSPGTHLSVDGGLLPAGSRWDASAVVSGPDGEEVTRQRFTFGLDDAGIAEGRDAPPVDPAAILAGLFLILSTIGIAYGAAGGTLPRTHGPTGRRAVLAGSAAGLFVGVLLAVAGVG